MSCQHEEFKSDVISTFGEDVYAEFIAYIDKALEDGELPDENEWVASHSIEKHNQLNHSYHFSFYQASNEDSEVCCTYYTGIDVGCEMVDYSLEGRSISHTKATHRILTGIEPNWSIYELREGVISADRRSLIATVVKGSESEIMSIIGKQDYDNYVTGGGTCATNSFYQERLARFENRSVHWLPVYKEVEVDRNII